MYVFLGTLKIILIDFDVRKNVPFLILPQKIGITIFFKSLTSYLFLGLPRIFESYSKTKLYGSESILLNLLF